MWSKKFGGELSLDARKSECKEAESGIKDQKPRENLIYVGADWEEARNIKKHLNRPVGVELS